MSTTEQAAVGRRRLTEKRPAAALVLGILAVLVLPGLFEPDPDAADSSSADESAQLATESGLVVTATPPDGWDVEPVAGGVVWRSGDAVVRIEAHDLDGRDPGAVGERLLQMDRRRGLWAAYDGAPAQSGDGRLTGQTCVVTAVGRSGACATLADGEVVVLAQTLGDVDDPALPLQDVLVAIGRAEP
ncbi:hypothetical protein ACQI4F_21940 [Mycolicibacterium vaccae]|uniref:hypothetical protein n=1 Tax=Mycolicibacterium vaccae TaxID=1810 RepID=UPI003CED8566